MAGISIQTKNASYYGAVYNSKKSAAGVVGTLKGKYAKKTTFAQKGLNQTVSTKKSQGIQSNKKQLLEDLEKPNTNRINLSELSDKEAAELKAAQIAAEKNESAEKAANAEETKKERKKIVFQGTSVYKQNGYLDLTKTKSQKSETKQKKKLHYSYKDVSSKIQRAKTSVSAGQAVIAAKRKVMELRRKASSGNVDSEDLQLALTHAKKMEMIAKRKKHNLETEEMVEHVKEQDERLEKMEDGYGDAQNNVIEAARNSVEQAQDEITEQRDAYAKKVSAEMERMTEEYEKQEYSEGETEELSEAMSEEMTQMIEEFGQEEMEMLEETMEMLEQLEAVNPHMSDRQLEDLKRKHRASEDKAITKANMEYLKGVMKQLEKESKQNSGVAATSQTAAYSPASVANPVITISIPTGISVDAEC